MLYRFEVTMRIIRIALFTGFLTTLAVSALLLISA